MFGHYAMATRFEVALPDLSPSAGRSVAEALFKEITRLELKCSFYRHNSELNRINQQALDNWVALDGEMLEMLCIAWRLWEGSEKAFDLTGCLPSIVLCSVAAIDFKGRVPTHCGVVRHRCRRGGSFVEVWRLGNGPH